MKSNYYLKADTHDTYLNTENHIFFLFRIFCAIVTSGYNIG